MLRGVRRHARLGALAHAFDTSDPPFWKWFVGGKINASYNCVDRHLAKYKNKAALIFVPEPEDEDPITADLPGAVRPRQRVRGAAARLLPA